MIRKQHFASAGVLAAICLALGASPAGAQAVPGHAALTTGAKAAPSAPGTEPAGGAATDQDPGSIDAERAGHVPVFAVTGVEVLRSAHAPTIDIVRVTGLVPSSGWTDMELVPLTAGTPSDGMLDLLLMGQAPDNSSDADGFVPVEAILSIEPGHPFKGVRARSAYNAVELHQLPGQVDAAPPTQDCSKCVGKLFLPTGQSPPAGASPDDVIKQEDLPPSLLVIKPTDGMRVQTPDPTRLTLMLGDDGRILDAFWN
jgi:hypothetical protein